MFARFARLVSRFWGFWLTAWALLLVATWWLAPPWDTVVADGEFAFLPDHAPSRRGEILLRSAFPDDRAESSVVIVLYREGHSETLRDEDFAFISKRLAPELKRQAQAVNAAAAPGAARRGLPVRPVRRGPADLPRITRIRTFEDQEAGALLISEDRQASVIIVDLTTDFMTRRNIAVVQQVDELIGRLHQQGVVPQGLQVALTGNAVLGRDMMVAETRSAKTIQSWTVWIVIVLLLVFYRAPVLAFVPVLTLFVATQVSLQLLAILAGAGYVNLFHGLQVYASVVVYAAGVDYNLFLISRYEEELGGQPSVREAMAAGLGKLGGSLTASAATVICGIGTLMFAQFGKFQEAGFGIAFSLVVMFCATMTLTPAVLRLFGRWALWPRWSSVQEGDRHPESSARGWLGGLMGRTELFGGLWTAMGRPIERWPATVWLVTVAVLSPLAAAAVLNYDNINYGLIQQLPGNAPSVVGTRVLSRHYPPGAEGPVTVLIRDDRVDFGDRTGLDLLATFTNRLKQRRSELEIADLRSVIDPLGLTTAGQRALPSGPLAVLAQPLLRERSIEHYVSHTRAHGRHVTRLDLVLSRNPFTRSSIQHLDQLEHAIRSELPAELKAGSSVYFVGPTASFRDLKAVGDSDRTRISLLVTGSVLVVLVLLLRRLAIPIYLIVSVLLGYLVTLGATFLVFWMLDRHGFPGLDWTVPIFLFTLLIAVGEDYNIILVTRVDEEQERHGPVRGVTEALRRTGATISGCGFIMAGTFASLAFGGSLARMYQLGFALTFGVLLDTFVIRPVLVPAYLVLVNDGRFGRLARCLGARPEPSAKASGTSRTPGGLAERMEPPAPTAVVGAGRNPAAGRVNERGGSPGEGH